jgi:hypothetical protein
VCGRPGRRNLKGSKENGKMEDSEEKTFDFLR